MKSNSNDMFIEVYHKGTFVNRAYIHMPENTDKRIPFMQRVEEKEKTIKLLIDDFRANTLPKLHRDNPNIQLAVVFESKMNEPQPTPTLWTPPADKKLNTKRLVQRTRFSGNEQAKHAKGNYSNQQFTNN